MICNPADIAAKPKKISMIIAGPPGMGKTTTALSAPDPLHIDLDGGLHRIAPNHRKAYIQPESYNDLLEDLTTEKLESFQTLVFDTGGELVELMKYWAIKSNSQYGQRDGSLSLKGYGAVGREFKRLIHYCRNILNKHLVVVFHSKEEKDGDNTRLRILVEGQTKDNVWQPMDLGGFMEVINEKRTIGFSNCERYYAKGTSGIKGIYTIPELNSDVKNDFLTKLFEQMNKNIAAEALSAELEQVSYEDAMTEIKKIMGKVKDAETASKAYKAFLDFDHVLTTKTEFHALLQKRVKELELGFNKATNSFESKKKADKEEPAAQEASGETDNE